MSNRRRTTVVKSISLKKKNASWLASECEKEDLTQSCVMNRMIKKMRESGKGIFW